MSNGERPLHVNSHSANEFVKRHVRSLGFTLIELLIVFVVLCVLASVVVVSLNKETGPIATYRTASDVCVSKPGESSSYVMEFPSSKTAFVDQSITVNLVLARTPYELSHGPVTSSKLKSVNWYPSCSVEAKLSPVGGSPTTLLGFGRLNLFANSISEWTWSFHENQPGRFVLQLNIRSRLMTTSGQETPAAPISTVLIVASPPQSWWHIIWARYRVLWSCLVFFIGLIAGAIVQGFFSPLGANLYRNRQRRIAQKESQK